MVRIKNFRGVRPRPDKVSEVTCPPYDVLDSDEARRLAGENPISFLRVVKPEIDLPGEIDLYDEAVYRRGKENLDRLIRQGILIREEKPCFYIYRLTRGEVRQTGLVAGVSIEDYEEGLIRKHEHTRAEKEADRIRHVNTLNANTGPVFLTYRKREDINRLITRVTAGEPLYDFPAEDGTRHTFWRMDDPALITEVRGLFARVDHLYVADGHHRAASGSMVGRERRRRNPHHTGREEYNYFLAGIFPHDQLRILAYNRVVRDLNGLSPEDFLEQTAARFEVEPAPGNATPASLHSFGTYLAGRWYRLTAREGTYPPSDPVKSLDVSILQENLLGPILGIKDPRQDKRIDFVGGIRGIAELSRRVDKAGGVAFALFPTSIEQLLRVADRGLFMPPKSTWFEPKLRSGLVVHLLD